MAQQMKEASRDTYRASVDCTRGTLHAIDGGDFMLAGVWPGGIGKGRTRWRGKDGQIVGSDNASGGLSLAQQWEVLCPGVTRATASAAHAASMAAAATARSAPQMNTAASAAPAAESGDACGGAPRCYSARPFTATVVSVAGAHLGDNTGDHILHVTLRVRNVGAAPLVLGYAQNTSTALDNLGNTYYWGRAGGPDRSAQGIGMVSSNHADPQFVLQPGQSREASFDLRRFHSGRQVLGTSFTYHVTLTQLEVLPSQQLRSVRDYVLEFPNLTASGGAQQLNDTIRKLGGLFRK